MWEISAIFVCVIVAIINYNVTIDCGAANVTLRASRITQRLLLILPLIGLLQSMVLLYMLKCLKINPLQVLRMVWHGMVWYSLCVLYICLSAIHAWSVWLHTNILHTYIHVHTYTCTYMHTYNMYTCIHAYMYNHINTCIHTCTCIHTYIHAYIHTYMHMPTPTYLHTHAGRRTNISNNGSSRQCVTV